MCLFEKGAYFSHQIFRCPNLSWSVWSSWMKWPSKWLPLLMAGIMKPVFAIKKCLSKNPKADFWSVFFNSGTIWVYSVQPHFFISHMQLPWLNNMYSMKYHLCQGVNIYINIWCADILSLSDSWRSARTTMSRRSYTPLGARARLAKCRRLLKVGFKKILILLFFVVDTQTMTASKLRKDDPSICKQKSLWSYINVYDFVISVGRRKSSI